MPPLKSELRSISNAAPQTANAKRRLLGLCFVLRPALCRTQSGSLLRHFDNALSFGVHLSTVLGTIYDENTVSL